MSLKRALDYPYDIPAHSYVMKDGEVHAYDESVRLDGRTPVLACGSNQSPTQLKRKFPTGVIPVMAGWLQGYDSVYSAHFTSYGSVAATYCAAANVQSRQMVTWLNDEQLQHMHETEALGVNYAFEEMKEISFLSDQGVSIETAYAYNSTRGPLRFEGKPIALQSIEAQNRTYLSLDEETLQREILSRISCEGDLETFINGNIKDKETRLHHTNQLVSLSLK